MSPWLFIVYVADWTPLHHNQTAFAFFFMIVNMMARSPHGYLLCMLLIGLPYVITSWPLFSLLKIVNMITRSQTQINSTIQKSLYISGAFELVIFTIYVGFSTVAPLFHCKIALLLLILHVYQDFRVILQFQWDDI